MSHIIDINGRVFGRWTVVSYSGNRQWRCRCECGTVRDIRSVDLRQCHTTSCGCSKDYATGSPTTTVKTGMSRTPEYTAWIRMRRSCYDRDCKDWDRYGGRGITVFEPWIHDFLAFFAHIGKRTGKGYSIDRYPNNNGNYEPGNVRWATAVEQARNRRTAHLIPWKGEEKSMVEWAEHLKIPYQKFRQRIRRGWSMERIVAAGDS